MASSEAMTSSTHSFAYSYGLVKKCLLKICETWKCHNCLIFQPIFIRFSLFCSENFTLSSEIKLDQLRTSPLSFVHFANTCFTLFIFSILFCLLVQRTEMHEQTACIPKAYCMQKYAPDWTIWGPKLKKVLTVGGGPTPLPHPAPSRSLGLGRFAPSQSHNLFRNFLFEMLGGLYICLLPLLYHVIGRHVGIHSLVNETLLGNWNLTKFLWYQWLKKEILLLMYEITQLHQNFCLSF